MAELDVQPKNSNSWWIWILMAVIAVTILLLLFNGCNYTTNAVA